jgi:hypothetical protein
MDFLDIDTENECQYCGSHVTPEFARQFGDRHDTVHRCGECDTYRRVRRGSGAGRDVSDPDPQIQGGRKHDLTVPEGDV